MALSEIKKEYIYRIVETGKRVDGRKFDEFRKVEIYPGIAKQAEGSARVKLGDTDVIAGVKIGVGEPYPDSPDAGVLSTAVELIPLASPTFESGPPSSEAIELARVVDRGIRESKCIDFSKLCITPGEKVWIIYLDINVVDDNGNLFDASSYASLAAIMNTIIPASKYDLGDDYPLSVEHYPISCTAVKLKNKIVFDPILDEDLSATARLTVAIREDNTISAMQKGLPGSFTVNEVKHIINTAKEISVNIRKKILSYSNDIKRNT